MKTKLLKKIRKRFEIKVEYNQTESSTYFLHDKKKKEFTTHWTLLDALDDIFEHYYHWNKIRKRRAYMRTRARFNKIK